MMIIAVYSTLTPMLTKLSKMTLIRKKHINRRNYSLSLPYLPTSTRSLLGSTLKISEKKAGCS